MITDSSSSSSNKAPEECLDNDSFLQSQIYESHKHHNYTSNARKRKKNNIILNAFEHEVNKKKTLPFDKENFELSLYNFYKKNKAYYNQAIVNTKSKLKEACMNLTHKLNHVRVASPHFKNSETRKPTFSSKNSHMVVDIKNGTQRGSPSPSINVPKSSRVYDESSLYKLKTYKPSDSYRDLDSKQFFMLKTFKGAEKDDLSAKDSNHDSYISSKFKPRQHDSRSLNNHLISKAHKAKQSEKERVNGIKAILQFNTEDYSLPPSLKSIKTASQFQTIRQTELPFLHQ